MLFKSPIFSQASGSIAGMTFAHNRGGQYTRSRVTPTDPGTAKQLAVRTAMATLAVRWATVLTAAQRTAWATYAENVAMTNRLGDTVYLTGQQHYLRSNVPRLQAGESIIDDGPTTYDLGDFTPFSFAVSASTDGVVLFTNTDDWANEDDAYLFVYASVQKAPTINYFKGPYEYVVTIDGDSITPPTSPYAFTSPPPLTQGNLVFARARISRADGRLSGIIDLGGTAIIA